jgi:uncharacterized protein YndB with AHSA1/START domain
MAASPELAPKADLIREPHDRVLVIERLLDAPRKLVFKAWTVPEHLVRWWGPHGFSLPYCKMELKPGGSFRCTMLSPEGTEHRLSCVYREIVAPEKLSFTWTWIDEEDQPGPETLVTVLLEEAGDQGAQTKLTLHQAIFESDTACAAHGDGWSQSLDRLVAYVESL